MYMRRIAPRMRDVEPAALGRVFGGTSSLCTFAKIPPLNRGAKWRCREVDEHPGEGARLHVAYTGAVLSGRPMDSP